MKTKEKLIEEVRKIVEEVDKTHKYSMSRIYTAYNEAFGTMEQPQSCASCLIRKVKELKIWLNEQEQTSVKKRKGKAKPSNQNE